MHISPPSLVRHATSSQVTTRQKHLYEQASLLKLNFSLLKVIATLKSHEMLASDMACLVTTV